MKFDCREDILQWTPLWTGERFEDGRPKVSADVLRRMRNITLEEAWGPLWNHGFRYQFQGDFRMAHPEKTMVGRAVTTVMVPLRPDLHETLLKYGHEQENRRGFFNQWVIDQLAEDDVVVVDLFDKVFQGTYVGGNLSTAIASRTKRGGAVIWGGVRDLEQILKIESTNTFYRGNDPTGIADVTMTGFNVPCRIGNAVCLPGDVVLATPSGVIFIPPHLAEEVIWGGVRDLEQILKIESTNTFYRGNDPTGIADVTMTGFNVPCRIGNAVCLPGDVVLATPSGVIFIPPHLAEEVVVGAEKSHVRDVWGFLRLDSKTYTTAQIDTAWTVAMWEDFMSWFRSDDRAADYRHLNWDAELEEAHKAQQSSSQVRL